MADKMTDKPPVELAPVLVTAMRDCRKDFNRMSAAPELDYCGRCPLLSECHTQERGDPVWKSTTTTTTTKPTKEPK